MSLDENRAQRVFDAEHTSKNLQTAVNTPFMFLDKRQVASTALVALPLSCLFALSGAVTIPLAIAAMAVFAFVVMYAGFLVLRAAGVADMPAAAAWVLGIFSTGVAVYGLVESLNVTAAGGFSIWAAFVFLLGIAAGRGQPSGESLDRRDMFGLLLCAMMTLVWCRTAAAAPQVFIGQRLLPIWIDYLIHGGVISQFGDVRAVGYGAIDLVGLPKALYHYASYLLPAVFAEPLDQPGFALATSVWLPLGFLTMCAGAYTLGATLGGAVCGIAALASLTIVPDASSYGLRNGYFSYYWNLLAMPGNTYAVGVSLVSVAFLRRWDTLRSSRTLLASALLAFGTLAFRANIFVLAFPAWLVTGAYSSRFFQKRRFLFVVSLILSVALAVFALYFILDNVAATADTWWRTGPALERFLDQVHQHQAPTGYAGWYQGLLDGYGRGVAIPVGVLLVFPASLGILCLLYPTALLLTRRSRQFDAIDMHPIFAIMSYTLLMIFAPSPGHGDSTAFTHLPFVLLYAVIAVWTAAMLIDWIVLRGTHVQDRLWRTLFVFMICALPVMWSEAAAMARPKFYWGRAYASFVPDEGLPAAAGFLRRNAKQGDVFAVSGLRLTWVAIDVASELNGLTGIPTYIARPWIQIAGKGRRGEVAMERWTALVGIERQESLDAAMEELRRRSVQWYVFVGVGGPRWDPKRGRAAFSQGRFAVYSSAER